MPAHLTRDRLWSLAHTERAALADDLAGLAPEAWRRPSLCSDWTVEHVVAHLTAAASLGTLRWFTSVVGARFDFDLHNQRRMTEQLGASPPETLARFRAVIDSTRSAPGPVQAWLGEVVVHAEDIRRPLGLSRAYPPETTSAVAEFYARRNLAVRSHSNVSGLRLEATDAEFAAGAGPLVRGSSLALIMAMAGRAAFCDELEGDGIETLCARIAVTA